MKDKLAMKFLQYWTTPKNLRTSVADVGLGQFTITSIFKGLIFNCPPPTIWPNYTKEVFPNSHLDNFTYNFSFFKVSKTNFTCFTCSSQDFLKTRISSKYTITKSSINGWNTSFLTNIKVAGGLQSPKGITNHSKRSCFVLKEVFHTSHFATTIWW